MVVAGRDLHGSIFPAEEGFPVQDVCGARGTKMVVAGRDLHGPIINLRYTVRRICIIRFIRVP